MYTGEGTFIMEQKKQGYGRGQGGQGQGLGGRGGQGQGCGCNEGHGQRRRRHGQGGQGAKTFRRVRALNFLDTMYAKRDLLKGQLETPELQSINPTLVGELKAIETVISEFTQAFEIEEYTEIE